MGFPRADRGLIPVQIEAMMTFHGQMTSSQQLYFRFPIYSSVHPPPGLWFAPQILPGISDVSPHIAYLKAATSSLVRMSHCGPTCESKRGKHSFFLNFEVSFSNFTLPQSLGRNPLQFLLFWSQEDAAESPSHTTCAHRRNHINEHVKFRKLLTLILCMYSKHKTFTYHLYNVGPTNVLCLLSVHFTPSSPIEPIPLAIATWRRIEGGGGAGIFYMPLDPGIVPVSWGVLYPGSSGTCRLSKPC